MDTKSLSLKTVRIIAQKNEFDWIHPYRNDTISKSIGSGFFINDDGVILTCAHVVIDAEKIVVEIPNTGKEKIDVEVLGICPGIDLAILKTLNYKNKDFYTLHEEDFIFDLDPGVDVYAIGFPLGQDNIKFTKGIISGRQNGLIQTDTAINSGNSGGPLIYENKVIGINTSKNTGVNIDNIGFATPVKYYHLYKDLLLNSQKRLINVPDIGLKVQNTSPTLIDIFSSKCNEALLVNKVFKGSPISKTGLKEGDLLCSINGIKINNFGLLEQEWFNQKINLEDYLLTLKLNSVINIEFFRKGKMYQKSFVNTIYTLAINEKYPYYEKKNIDYEIFGGMIVMELTLNHIQHIKSIINYLFKSGDVKEHLINILKYFDKENQIKSKLVITHIFPNSYLSNYELLNSFDIISTVNNRECNTLEQYRKALLKVKRNKFITIKTESNSQIALDINEIKLSEPGFATTYKYKLSETYNKIFKSRRIKTQKNRAKVGNSRSKKLNKSKE